MIFIDVVTSYTHNHIFTKEFSPDIVEILIRGYKNKNLTLRHYVNSYVPEFTKENILKIIDGKYW